MAVISGGMEPTYWLDLFTYRTWGEFLAAGANVSGFRENRWKAVQSMKPGDVLLCYLTGVSRWIGLLEITRPRAPPGRRRWRCRAGTRPAATPRGCWSAWPSGAGSGR